MHLQEEQIFFYDKLWYINQRNILLFLLGDQNVMDVCVTEYTTPQMCSVFVSDAAIPPSSTVNGTTPVKIIKVLKVLKVQWKMQISGSKHQHLTKIFKRDYV